MLIVDVELFNQLLLIPGHLAIKDKPAFDQVKHPQNTVHSSLLLLPWLLLPFCLAKKETVIEVVSVLLNLLLKGESLLLLLLPGLLLLHGELQLPVDKVAEVRRVVGEVKLLKQANKVGKVNLDGPVLAEDLKRLLRVFLSDAKLTEYIFKLFGVNLPVPGPVQKIEPVGEVVVEPAWKNGVVWNGHQLPGLPPLLHLVPLPNIPQLGAVLFQVPEVGVFGLVELGEEVVGAPLPLYQLPLVALPEQQPFGGGNLSVVVGIC